MKFPRNSVFLFVSAFLVFPQFAFAVPQTVAPVQTDYTRWNPTYKMMESIFNGKDVVGLSYEDKSRDAKYPNGEIHLTQMTQKQADIIINNNNTEQTTFFAVKLENPEVPYPYDSAMIGYRSDFKKNAIFVQKGHGKNYFLQRSNSHTFWKVAGSVISKENVAISPKFTMPMIVDVPNWSHFYYIPNAPVEAKTVVRTKITVPASIIGDVLVFLLKADVAKAKIYKHRVITETVNGITKKVWDAGVETTWEEFQQDCGAKDKYGRAPLTPNPWYFVVAVAEKSINISFSFPPWAKRDEAYFAAR